MSALVVGVALTWISLIERLWIRLPSELLKNLLLCTVHYLPRTLLVDLRGLAPSGTRIAFKGLSVDAVGC